MCEARMFKFTFKLISKFDVKTRRAFLKRCKADNISQSDLFLGNMITIMSRTMKLADYGDLYTKRALSNNQQRFVCFKLSKKNQFLHLF
jgi:hypothetical protein